MDSICLIFARGFECFAREFQCSILPKGICVLCSWVRWY